MSLFYFSFFDLTLNPSLELNLTLNPSPGGEGLKYHIILYLPPSLSGEGSSLPE
jgi:hypothetical protein